MRTAWLYYNGQPLQSVIVTDGMTERDIRQKMLADLESVPGVVCNQGELPCERISKIYHGQLRYF
jgi:hypothetical protein